MPAETTISTIIPASTSPESVLKALHDHECYIRITCPQLISYKHISGTPNQLNESCLYEVTDKKPIGQTTFKLTLTNRDDGIEANVDGKAPTGALNIISKWVVSGNKLDEVVTIDSNMLMKKMIKGNVEKSHPEQHQGFYAAAAQA
ncbi:uncharacterized protein BCR38DRAFT_471995 [Pseudomassariella vexata]|uniref:DUF7053 domain-containing protein n=1 Tax=Pseudomassariella vexata TaxID=1141098 RepID=A0A1Y2EA21_9PEZI|nr:uncharacterized protein BCR38DRAFT_471995 [Pseudomassariella vexata]ORY68430.1 hypothetical protein BCR38DRAFT_471995 [Pseudomassariella vexata]